MSFGGGRGKYANVHGDVPMALFNTVLLDSTVNAENGGEVSQEPRDVNHASERDVRNTGGTEVVGLVCLLKNVMSLKSEEREQLLLTELGSLQWDITVLNETWRDAKFVRLDHARGGAAVGTPPPRVGSGREAIG